MSLHSLSIQVWSDALVWRFAIALRDSVSKDAEATRVDKFLCRESDFHADLTSLAPSHPLPIETSPIHTRHEAFSEMRDIQGDSTKY